MSTPRASDKPKRIQRRRSKGWRMPEGVVYVGRPSRWGNPFVAGQTKILTDATGTERLVCSPKDVGEAIGFFNWFICHDESRLETVRRELAGRDLACWCPLDQPCHADVLLLVAND